jgi:hypothetical protein
MFSQTYGLPFIDFCKVDGMGIHEFIKKFMPVELLLSTTN